MTDVKYRSHQEQIDPDDGMG